MGPERSWRGNGGHALNNQRWVFGSVVRGESTECFAEFVENRSRQMKVIGRRIVPNTTIISDCWRGEYRGLPIFFPEFNFTHATVNHSVNVIDPNDATIHTRSIEGFWFVIKRQLRIYDTNLGDTPNDHLIEILYRRIHGQTDDSLEHS